MSRWHLCGDTFAPGDQLPVNASVRTGARSPSRPRTRKGTPISGSAGSARGALPRARLEGGLTGLLRRPAVRVQPAHRLQDVGGGRVVAPPRRLEEALVPGHQVV